MRAKTSRLSPILKASSCLLSDLQMIDSLEFRGKNE